MLIDAAPEPLTIRIFAAVILFVIGLVVLLFGGLVFFLWFRKRSKRGEEMIFPEDLAAAGAEAIQPSNPNQP